MEARDLANTAFVNADDLVRYDWCVGYLLPYNSNLISFPKGLSQAYKAKRLDNLLLYSSYRFRTCRLFLDRRLLYYRW